MVDRCSGTNVDGTPCSAAPRPGSAWCVWHDPATKGQRAEWSKRGGAARSNQRRATKALKGDVRDIAAVKASLFSALAKVEAGDLDPGPANAMANLARAIVSVAGVADFEVQLAEMRREIAELARSRSAS